MDQLGVDIRFLLETKLTGGIYTCYSSGYSVLALTVTNSYEVEETKILGANVISLYLIWVPSIFLSLGVIFPPLTWKH